MTVFSLLLMTLLITSAGQGQFSPLQELKNVTDILNPRSDSAATLEIQEWNGRENLQQGTYEALFQGQDNLLLHKMIPEKDRGRSILLLKNRLWVELPSARRPLQLSTEQRWTSDAFFADLARANFNRDYVVIQSVAEGNSAILHLYLQSKNKDVPYANVELWLNKGSGTPIRARFSTGSKARVKDCAYSSFEKVVGAKRPTKLLFTDPVRREWRAEVTFTHWIMATAERKLFDPAAMNKEESVIVVSETANEIPASDKEPPEHEMTLVPEGSFTMGRDNGFPDEQPAHIVSLKAFWIDRTEVTTGQYKRFLARKGRPLPQPPQSPSMPKDYFINPLYNGFPAVNVTWKNAEDYCHSLGKRLPSEAEWEKAARGTDQRLYPWGNQWDVRMANSREAAVSSQPRSTRHFTFHVGVLPGNASPYGALDMAGNVWEWVEDWYVSYPGNTSPGDAYGERYKVVRGGSWVNNSLSLLTVARDFAPQEFGYDSIGFRCAKNSD